MVKNRFKNQVKENRSYSGADINRDLVMMIRNLKFKKIMEEKKWCNRKLKI